MQNVQLMIDGKVAFQQADVTPEPAPIPTPTPDTTTKPAPAVGFHVSAPKVLSVTKTIDVPITGNQNRLHFEDWEIHSLITDGSPVLRLHIDQAGVNLTDLLLEKITIYGNGKEGDGVVVTCPTNSSWIYRSVMRDVNVVGVGGNGIISDGSFFESSFFNTWANDCGKDGMIFRHNGGQVSAMSMFGGGARKNGGNGISILNGTRDVKMYGLYFCENAKWGVNADQGNTGLWGCGFENNAGGVTFQNYLGVFACTFSTDGRQKSQIDGFITGQATFIDINYEDYGGGHSSLGNLNGTANTTVTCVGFDGSGFKLAGGVKLKQA